MDPRAGTTTRIREAFAAVGVHGRLHAIDLADHGREVAVEADEPVVLSSVFKLLLVAELAERFAAGTLEPAQTLTLEPGARTAGPAGVAAMRDTVVLSLRDLAYLAIAVSDVAAGDALFDLLGEPALNARCAALGLRHTAIRGCSRDLLAATAAHQGDLAHLDALDPAHSSASTPRDMTRLLTAIWEDLVGDAEQSAMIRGLMARQVWPHRLVSGFPFDDVRVSGKTGTLPGLRNEIGVVEYPDGGRYAVAVFTRTDNPAMTLPQADAVIGRAGRAAVDALRAPAARERRG